MSDACPKPDIAMRLPTSARAAVRNKTTPLPAQIAENDPHASNSGRRDMSLIQSAQRYAACLMEGGQRSEDGMQIRVGPSLVGDSRRIFVVETDEIIRSVLKFIVHNENETHALTSLEQAYAEGRERRPDLVLLGLGIVRDGGVSVLADMATRLPGAKILLVADSADEPLARDCLDSGAHAVLGKPITIDSVLRTVDALLDSRDQPA